MSRQTTRRRTPAGTVLILVLLMLTVTAAVAEQPLLEVGQEAPDFTLPGLDGGTSTLTARRAEGPVVLVFFRGVW